MLQYRKQSMIITTHMISTSTLIASTFAHSCERKLLLGSLLRVPHRILFAVSIFHVLHQATTQYEVPYSTRINIHGASLKSDH
jgi:hypothetical protein